VTGDSSVRSEAPVATGGEVPLLRLAGIVKSFPGCLANDHVDLAIRAGEIHALLGENGAGKSTLVKIMYGVLRPDAGEIRWRGEPVQIANPAFARKLGIGMVFQHFSLFRH
jgi:simple sugar transport system ATP-binding protein